MTADRYRVIGTPANNGRPVVQKFYRDMKIWCDVGEPCDTYAEAYEKMDRERLS